MSDARTIAKNTSVLYVAQIITYVLGFFITIYTVRYLSVDDYGILAAALALTGIYVVFGDLGLSTLTVREVVRDKSLTQKYVGNTTIMKLFLSLFTFLLTVITVYIFGYNEATITVVYILTIAFIFNAFSSIFYSIFQAYQKMEYQSVATILNSVVMLIGTLLAIYLGLDVIAFALVYLAANAINFLYVLVTYAWKFYLPNVEMDLDFWKPTIKEALPLSITSIFAVLVFRIDSVMLSVMSGMEAVGFYNAAYRLMEALIFFPAVYTTAIFPVFSTLYISSKKPLKTAYLKSFKYLTILSLPIAVGITLLAEPIILLLFKSEYIPSILTLQLVVWVLPFIFVNYIQGSLLTAMNRQVTVLKITAASLVLNVGMNLALIPTYSYLGAALATVITEIFSVALSFYVLSTLVARVEVHKVIFKPGIACLVMALFILLVQTNLFLEIAISAVIYFAVLIALKGFTPDDYDLFRQILNIKREN
ncbi:MAG: flippase [Methanobacteriaceae archaeon]|jgi:O-antigen/teichoic acid export membrane protein|nr:flippase [Methanobacteriaceae archaeon]OPY24617.1 MAG: colanic acid exporter [Methanobacterium sp. PtaU1.Bin097]